MKDSYHMVWHKKKTDAFLAKLALNGSKTQTICRAMTNICCILIEDIDIDIVNNISTNNHLNIL